MSTGTLPKSQFSKTKSICKFGAAECSFPHWKVEKQPNKKLKCNEGKKCSCYSAKCTTVELCITGHWAVGHRFLGMAKECWSQFDEYDSKGLHCVKQTSEKMKIRRSGKFKSKIPHQRSPTLWSLRDRSPGETARQARCARGDAWEPARNIHKLKKEDKATFYSPSEEWIIPAAPTITSEEREFVVDSGASMHMVSKNDLNESELETGRASKNPTVTLTANSEVPAKEEATVSVRDLDLFVTVMRLGNTPAVLSLGKLCKEFGYSYHWTSGQRPHLIKKGKKIHRDTSNHVPFVVLGLGCPRVPLPHRLLLHLHRRKLWLTRKFQQHEEVKVRARTHQHEETRGMNQQNSETHIKVTTRELQDDELQGVLDWLQEFKEGLIDESFPEHRDFQFFSWITFGVASK